MIEKLSRIGRHFPNQEVRGSRGSGVRKVRRGAEQQGSQSNGLQESNSVVELDRYS